MTHVAVSILVELGFIPTELALVQDVLRVANRVSQDVRFDVRVCTTEEQGLIEGLGGMCVRAGPLDLDDTVHPDFLVVLGGKGIGRRFSRIRPRLQWCERMGQKLILMSDAAFEWKRLYPDAECIATHWEEQQVQATETCQPHGRLPLFAKSGRVTTSAGMVSAADVILHRIVAPQSAMLAQIVSNILLIDGIRDGTAEQPRSENDINALRQIKLEAAIAAMEKHLEDPLSVTELAALAGLSQRQFERKFKLFLGQTPAAFYRSLRLRRARKLIEQTTMPFSDITVACGLGTTSSFAKLFSKEFGISPSRFRTQLSTLGNHPRAELQVQGPKDAPFSLPPRSPRSSAHAAGADGASIQRVGC